MTDERLPPLSAAAAGEPASDGGEGEDVVIEEDTPIDEAEERRKRRKARAKLALRIPDDEIARPNGDRPASSPDERPASVPDREEAATQEMAPVPSEPITGTRIISVGPPPSDVAEKVSEKLAEKTVEMAALSPSTLDVVAAAAEEARSGERPKVVLPPAAVDDGKTPIAPMVMTKDDESFDVPVDEDLSSGDIEESVTVPRPLDVRRSSVPPPAKTGGGDVMIPPAPKRPSSIPPPPASAEPLEIDEVEAAAVLSSRPPPRQSSPPPAASSAVKVASIPPSPPIPVDAMASSPRVSAVALVDADELDNKADEAELDTADVIAVESVKHPPPAKTSTPPTPRRPSSDPPRGAAAPQNAGKAPVIVPTHGAKAESKDAVSSRKRAKLWWEELFNDDFLRATPKLTDKQIAAEVDFVEDSLAVAKGGALLDLGCGTGRHAIELTRRGYNVVGFDLSLAMLSRAADEAQDRDQKINFIQGDMREMTFEGRFDGIFCWGTTFGFFDEEKNLQVLKNVFRALRSGGQFLLDVANRDFIIHQSPSLAWFEGEGCVCMDEMAMDWITSRMKVKRTMMMEDGRNREVEYSIRLYSLHELGKILHDLGFRICEVSGRTATPGVFLGPDSPRTLILAEKP
jgi:SAM-dependent methyltransferase